MPFQPIGHCCCHHFYCASSSYFKLLLESLMFSRVIKNSVKDKKNHINAWHSSHFLHSHVQSLFAKAKNIRIKNYIHQLT